LRFLDYNPEYQHGSEQEPLIEKGKDRFRFWSKVLIAVILAGILIGYAASASYTVYPYRVSVGGTFVASDGSKAQLVGMVACNEYIYANSSCPDPGQSAAWDCEAPPVMKLTQFCNELNLEANPGHYSLSLRNGEDYTVVGYMVNSAGGFDKICNVTIVLSPDLRAHNSTQDLAC
jgi:hypothetical protein